MSAAICRSFLLLAVALATPHGFCQSFHYVDPGVASCPAAPAPSTAAPKTVARGVPVHGTINVTCGFDQGSYTVTLNSTDTGAAFRPKTFLVNFGHIVGKGDFSVTFSTLGVQRVLATITSNMGSPPMRGSFVSPADEFNIVIP